MNVKEASAYIQVSTVCMYRLLKQGLIPGACRVGASHRIRKDILDAYFQNTPAHSKKKKIDRRFKRYKAPADRDYKDRSSLDEFGR